MTEPPVPVRPNSQDRSSRDGLITFARELWGNNLKMPNYRAFLMETGGTAIVRSHNFKAYDEARRWNELPDTSTDMT
jgi:hypothetical protein